MKVRPLLPQPFLSNATRYFDSFTSEGIYLEVTKMKLAEALILRADCQKRIAQLKARLLVNAKVQEGDAPAGTPQELIAELDRVSTELLSLIKRINRTNSATAFAGRGTI